MQRVFTKELRPSLRQVDKKANDKNHTIMTNMHMPHDTITSTFQSLLGWEDSLSVYRSEPTVYLQSRSVFIIKGFRQTLIMLNSSLHF